MDHLQVFLVTHYLLIVLQCEIHIVLFTYTGHEATVLVFLYILSGVLALVRLLY
jgi:hypothetical protein